MIGKVTAIFLLALALPSIALGQANYPYVISNVAGSYPMGDGGLSVVLEFPSAVAVDSNALAPEDIFVLG